MKLNSIFSSGALLLQNSVTEFRGEGIPGSVIPVRFIPEENSSENQALYVFPTEGSVCLLRANPPHSIDTA